jgi:glycosyltransferase involved in cell wall biosynthesis
VEGVGLTSIAKVSSNEARPFPFKITVVIPVYNAEQYLTECVQSLIKQTLQECEFIFVDDGSRDGSRTILERYRREDGRIRVIYQENRGVSAARNVGISVAKGEYIGFVDADDWVKPEMFEVMFEAAVSSRSDIVVIDYESQIGERKGCSRHEFPADRRLDRTYIKKEVMPLFMMGWSMNTVWNKLFRKQLIYRHDISFRKGMTLGEDKVFAMELFAVADSMIYLNYVGYHYREVYGSATRNLAKMDYFAHAIEVYEEKYPQAYEKLVEPGELTRLKSIEFIKAIISYVHLYYEPANGLSLRQKIGSVKEMLAHPAVRAALPAYAHHRQNAGRYEQWILRMMGMQSALGLYGLTAYSRFRNDTNTGG